MALSEPLEAWRAWARTLKAIVDVAGHLQAGRTGKPSDWALLKLQPPPTFRGSFLQAAVNMLVTDFGHLRPVALWSSSARRFQIRLSGQLFLNGLPAALTAQLLAVVAGGRSLAFCAEPGCGQMFEVKNRSADRDAYCPKHDTAAGRAASRRYYSKNRDEILNRRKEKRHGTQARSE